MLKSIGVMKKMRIEDLEQADGLFYVGHLVDLDSSPWVNKGMAEEILEVVNSHVDAINESILLSDRN